MRRSEDEIRALILRIVESAPSMSAGVRAGKTTPIEEKDYVSLAVRMIRAVSLDGFLARLRSLEQAVARPLEPVREVSPIVARQLTNPPAFSLQSLAFFNRRPALRRFVDPDSHEVTGKRVTPPGGESLGGRGGLVVIGLTPGQRLDTHTQFLESLQLTGRVQVRSAKPLRDKPPRRGAIPCPKRAMRRRRSASGTSGALTPSPLELPHSFG